MRPFCELLPDVVISENRDRTLKHTSRHGLLYLLSEYDERHGREKQQIPMGFGSKRVSLGLYVRR